MIIPIAAGSPIGGRPHSASTSKPKNQVPMKLNHLLSIAVAGSFALVACDKQTTAIDDKANELKDAAGKKIDEVKDAAKEKASAVGTAIDKAADAAKDTANKAADAAKDAANKAVDATKDAAGKAVDGVKDAVPPLPGAPK